MKKNYKFALKIITAMLCIAVITTSCTSEAEYNDYRNATHILPVANAEDYQPIALYQSQSWSGIKEVKAQALRFINENVQFYSTDDKNLTIETDGKKWTLSYKYFDKTIVDEWAKENKELENIGVYIRFMIEQSINNNFYYLPNGKDSKSLVAVKNEYEKKQQAVGGLKFHYIVIAERLYIDKVEFVPIAKLQELDDWIESQGV